MLDGSDGWPFRGRLAGMAEVESMFERAVRVANTDRHDEALVLAVLAVAEAVNDFAARLLDNGEDIDVVVRTREVEPVRVELGVAVDRPDGRTVWLPS